MSALQNLTVLVWTPHPKFLKVLKTPYQVPGRKKGNFTQRPLRPNSLLLILVQLHLINLLSEFGAPCPFELHKTTTLPAITTVVALKILPVEWCKSVGVPSIAFRAIVAQTL